MTSTRTDKLTSTELILMISAIIFNSCEIHKWWFKTEAKLYLQHMNSLSTEYCLVNMDLQQADGCLLSLLMKIQHTC